MAKKLKLFDTPPSMSATPQGVEDYVGGDAASAFNAYQGRQPGILTGIGRAMSGISAPFVGDFEYAMKQQKLQQQSDQADMEFQRYMMMSGRGRNVFTIDPVTNSLVPAGQIGTKDIVRSPYVTPEARADAQTRAIAKRDLNKKLPGISSTLSAFEDLERLADSLPDFDPGILNQSEAKVKVALGKYKADKRFTDYEAALAKAFAPATRAVLQEVGTLNEGDIERSSTTLGKMELPRDSKKENIRSLRNQVKIGLEEQLAGAGLTMDDLKDLHPTAYKKLFGGGENVNEALVEQYMKKYPGRSREQIIRAMQKGSK